MISKEKIDLLVKSKREVEELEQEIGEYALPIAIKTKTILGEGIGDRLKDISINDNIITIYTYDRYYGEEDYYSCDLLINVLSFTYTELEAYYDRLRLLVNERKQEKETLKKQKELADKKVLFERLKKELEQS
jgi:hypothetical protein